MLVTSITSVVLGLAVILLVRKVNRLERRTISTFLDQSELIGEALQMIEFIGRQLNATPEERAKLQLEALERFVSLRERTAARKQKKE